MTNSRFLPTHSYLTTFTTSKGFLGLGGKELHGSGWVLSDLLQRQPRLLHLCIETRLNEADTSYVASGLQASGNRNL